MTPQARDGEDPVSTPAPQGRVTVASVDDDTLIREGVARLLTGLDVVATFPRVEALLEARPVVDVVLLDLSIPAALVSSPRDILQGISGVAAVVQAGYQVLIYTNECRREVLAGCLAAGAHGVVHKSEPLPAIVQAVREVADGQIVVTTALSGLAEVVQRRGSMARLSPRQFDVLRGRARGESFKSIAARLYIAPKTAEEYMSEVNRRFAEYLRDHSAADLERLLGVGPGDLMDRSSTGTLLKGTR
ncbi:MAG TPA: response regulator transcription factor [Dermatophilaceae bacterium]